MEETRWGGWARRRRMQQVRHGRSRAIDSASGHLATMASRAHAPTSTSETSRARPLLTLERRQHRKRRRRCSQR